MTIDNYLQSETILICHRPLLYLELGNFLNDARYWVELETYEREEFAARFHHRFVKIHPFPNVNGRYARIMTDVALETILDVLPIELGARILDVESEHRQKYINALRAADGNDYKALIDFFEAG